MVSNHTKLVDIIAELSTASKLGHIMDRIPLIIFWCVFYDNLIDLERNISELLSLVSVLVESAAAQKPDLVLPTDMAFIVRECSCLKGDPLTSIQASKIGASFRPFNLHQQQHFK
uniref:AlNc14C77G5125 protein n=1 Tax=Albugo laibachii Nc14 TaxID=890382 RepID=F0WES5_9STRA|nr:AlNc14C77G5125 [Albugo laibachii Nc14]|eukprot:CCA19707.1 AlNc14C77G5125 [Albugo laibachii Nc14]